MSEVNVGDRVVIKSVASRCAAKYVNLIGTVVTLLPSGRPIVETAGPNPTRVIATAVEAEPEQKLRELHQSERALYAAENHSWRDEEAAVEKLHRYGIIDDETLSAELRRINDERSRTALDRRRTQAAEFAHRILGSDADLDDLLRLAEWALNEQTERVTFNPGGVIFTPNDAETTRLLAEGLAKSGRIVAEPQETPRPPANLEIRDKDGDCLHLAYTHTLAGIVAVIDARSHGDVCATYVNAEDADRIIAFLQAAKAAKA